MFSEVESTWIENLTYSEAKKKKCVDPNQNAIFLFFLSIHLFFNLFTIWNFDLKPRNYFNKYEFQNYIIIYFF